jgi:hypothetical protein
MRTLKICSASKKIELQHPAPEFETSKHTLDPSLPKDIIITAPLQSRTLGGNKSAVLMNYHHLSLVNL